MGISTELSDNIESCFLASCGLGAPCFISKQKEKGNGVSGFLRASGYHQRISPYLQSFESRLWPSRGMGQEATGSMNPRLFSLWIQTYGKYRFSCIVTKNPFQSFNTTNSIHIYSQIYLRDCLVLWPGILRKYENVECMKTLPSRLPYVAVLPEFPQIDRISSQRKKLQGKAHWIRQFWILLLSDIYTMRK